MLGLGAGDGPLVHGAAWTRAVDTGWGGGSCRVYLMQVQLSPSEEVQIGEVWSPLEKVQNDRVVNQQEVRGAVPWEQNLLG